MAGRYLPPLWVFWLLCGGLLCCGHATAMPARQLVVSTHPLYLIASAVTQGIETPTRLLAADQDGHHIQLSPQQRRTLQQADWVLWIGRSYEAPLAELLLAHPHALSFEQLNLLHWRPLRDVQGRSIAGSRDPHVWLDPHNARKMAWLIAEYRARQYPQDAARYRHNAQRFSQRLLLQRATAPQQFYMSYHDAYQYLEHSLGLRLLGSFTADHDSPPSGKQLLWLQQQQRSTPAHCLLSPSRNARAYVEKFAPIQLLIADETFAQANDFVQAWQHLRQRIQQCSLPVESHKNRASSSYSAHTLLTPAVDKSLQSVMSVHIMTAPKTAL